MRQPFGTRNSQINKFSKTAKLPPLEPIQRSTIFCNLAFFDNIRVFCQSLFKTGNRVFLENIFPHGQHSLHSGVILVDEFDNAVRGKRGNPANDLGQRHILANREMVFECECENGVCFRTFKKTLAFRLPTSIHGD